VDGCKSGKGAGVVERGGGGLSPARHVWMVRDGVLRGAALCNGLTVELWVMLSLGLYVPVSRGSKYLSSFKNGPELSG
jgi:hypothetical protein